MNAMSPDQSISKSRIELSVVCSTPLGMPNPSLTLNQLRTSLSFVTAKVIEGYLLE
jgi:hypothetical protein